MRRPLDGLALVSGAMAPDIAYFIRSTSLEVTAQSWYEPFTNATTTHSVAGLLPTTLLLALGLYLMLRAAVRPVSWLGHGRREVPVAPLADATADRPDGALRRRTARAVAVLLSLLVGALTHIVWDSATSDDGFLATRFDGLNETAFADLSWIRASQHVSTVIGITVLAVVLWRRRRSLISADAAVRRRALRVIMGFIAVGSGAAVVSLLARFDPSASTSRADQVENALSIAAKGAGVAVAAAMVVTIAVWWSCLPRIDRAATAGSAD